MVQDDIKLDQIIEEKKQADAAHSAHGAPSGSPSSTAIAGSRLRSDDDSRSTTDGSSIDDTDGSSHSKKKEFETRLARPLDRLAAAMADLVIFMPIATIVVAPLRRQSTLAQMLGHETDWTVAIAGGLALGFLLFVLYQTVFTAMWGATPGKRVFGIRVESVWTGQKPRPLSAFLRAIAWSIEVFLGGAPFAAVYGNEKRRPFHDRLADTVVVSARPSAKPAGLPTIPELTLASGITAAALGFAAALAVASLARLKTELQDGNAIASEMESKGLLCHAVTEAQEKWTPNLGNHDPAIVSLQPESRLDVALALFGAESLDENCLQMEADYSIWQNQETTAAYLAEAMVNADNEDLYNSYLDKSCATDEKSYACGIAHLVRHDEEAEADSNSKAATIEAKANEVADADYVEEMLQANDARTPSYFKVWMIRRLMEESRYKEALARIDEVSPHRSIGYFFARERMRALWNLDKKSDARLAMRSSIEALDPEQRVEMAQWLCFNEASSEGCTDDTRYACNMMRTAVDRESRWFESPEIVATYVHGESCRGDLNEKHLSELELRLPEGQGKDYVQGLEYLRKNDRKKAAQIFRKIASVHEQNETFFVEANVQLAELAESPTELNQVKSAWMAMQPSEMWRYFGLRLSGRFTAMRSWNESLEVGLKMIESDHNDRQVYKSLVIAAYRSGDSRMARGFLNSLRSIDGRENQTLMPTESPRALRLPASNDEFKNISQELGHETSALMPLPADAGSKLIQHSAKRSRR